MRIVKAEYEANDVKGIALKYLSILDDGRHSHQLMNVLFEGHSGHVWHLRYVAIRDIIDRFPSPLHLDLLQNAVNDSNPFIMSFATTILFAKSDSENRTDFVRRLLSCESIYVQKIGLYLAYRYRIVVDPELVPPPLDRLVDEDRIRNMVDFHDAIRELFRIPLVSEFPIRKFFGDVSNVNQALSDIRLHRSQGMRPFLDALNCILHEFFGNWVRYFEQPANAEQRGFPDDDELTDVMNNLEPRVDGSYKWNDGKQSYLLNKASSVMYRYLEDAQEREGLTVRDKMFISYSSDDMEWRKTLVKAIESHFGQDPPVWYYDGNTDFSDDVEEEILKARSETRVAILLTSNNYFSSGPIMKLEYPYFKEQRLKGNLRIMWIPCEPSPAAEKGLANVWTPVGRDPLSGKSEHDQLDAFDIVARKPHEYYYPN